jgi:dihydroorotate dehydrogenase (NAD+) catalytic subunit
MGGVWNGRDALDLIACGATHVALGTVLFADPDAPQRVRDELRGAASEAGFDDPENAFCTAFRDVANPVDGTSPSEVARR